jgi:hypothetical protein
VVSAKPAQVKRSLDMEYLPKDAPIWAVLIVILIVNTFPKIGKVLSEIILPARFKKQEKLLESDLQTRKGDIEWERSRILREEAREDKQVETLLDIGKTLLLVQMALDQGNKEHASIISLLERISNQSEEEHRGLLASIAVSQRLYDIMITKLEERRQTDFSQKVTS